MARQRKLYRNAKRSSTAYWSITNQQMQMMSMRCLRIYWVIPFKVCLKQKWIRNWAIPSMITITRKLTTAEMVTARKLLPLPLVKSTSIFQETGKVNSSLRLSKRIRLISQTLKIRCCPCTPKACLHGISLPI